MIKNKKWIAFDGDDTLWHNEKKFRASEDQFFQLFADKINSNELNEIFHETVLKNLKLYGYGVKSMVLAMMESALKIDQVELTNDLVKKIINIGKEQLNLNIELMPHCIEVLKELKRRKHKIMLITKGDLHEQMLKLKRLNIINLFDRIEIVDEKNEKVYQEILNKEIINIKEFLMIGNSVKSDVLPVLNIGGYALHIPYEISWKHEEVDTVGKIDQIYSLGDLLN